MIFVYVFLSFVVGLSIWYFAFYYNYENSSNIDTLKKNYKQSQDQIESLEHDLKEYKLQNEVLRKEIQDTKNRNQDLEKVVSELSRYTYIINEAWKKSQELAKLLWVYDKDVEERVQRIMSENNDSNEQEALESNWNSGKKFF